jgi:hypothetical protein
MTSRLLLFSFVLTLITGNAPPLSAQHFQSIHQAEDSLKSILAAINQAKDDSTKNIFNQQFASNLSEALQMPSADSYPFDSLKTLVKITSTDNKFRIFHWNLPTSDGRHHYYGFLKLLSHEPPMVYKLSDKSDSLPSPETALLNNRDWFGALYYKIIPAETSAGEKIYTLLGWAGSNALITQKVIEVLGFDELDRPHFGMKLFPDYHEGGNTRIIFRYSAATTMSLKYELQPIAVKQKYNSKKRVFDYTVSEIPMIIMDRMVPPDPRMEGQYQFYVAAGDEYDGFIFRQNHWAFMAGIDARNKK